MDFTMKETMERQTARCSWWKLKFQRHRAKLMSNARKIIRRIKSKRS
jgi:hypothetical protein